MEMPSKEHTDGHGRALVLAVDDETAILKALRRTLRHLPIRLLCMESAEAAITAIGAEVPVAIVSDHHLPGMSGLELLGHVRLRWPGVRLALHSGDPTAQQLAARAHMAVIEKGAHPEVVRRKVMALVGPAERKSGLPEH